VRVSPLLRNIFAWRTVMTLINGVLPTFGDSARYDDEAWDEHYEGRNGVRLFYAADEGAA
jgi:hypothetical protein